MPAEGARAAGLNKGCGGLRRRGPGGLRAPRVSRQKQRRLICVSVC